jgi:hypothetical protein
VAKRKRRVGAEGRRNAVLESKESLPHGRGSDGLVDTTRLRIRSSAMRYAQILLVATVWPCMGTTPAPYFGQCKLLGQILDTAKSRTPATATALDLLEHIAQGRADTLPAGAEAQVGVPPGKLREKDFRAPEVRACALWNIGASGLPGAIEFLSKFTLADVAEDPGRQVWPVAQIALRNARLNQVSERQSREEFLENTLTEPHDAIAKSAVENWAVDQLCDGGFLAALPVIRKSIRNRMNGQRDEDEVQFCEGRIRVASSNPDPIKALASVLSSSLNRTWMSPSEDKLTGWAVARLDAMHSPAADAELDRFAADIAKLHGEPATQLWVFRETIQHLRTLRTK